MPRASAVNLLAFVFLVHRDGAPRPVSRTSAWRLSGGVLRLGNAILMPPSRRYLLRDSVDLLWCYKCCMTWPQVFLECSMSTWRLGERESCVSVLKSYFQVRPRMRGACVRASELACVRACVGVGRSCGHDFRLVFPRKLAGMLLCINSWRCFFCICKRFLGPVPVVEWLLYLF